MGTYYEIAEGVALAEMSCKVTFLLENETNPGSQCYDMTAQELRAAIIRQIEVLSYISEDPYEVLKRFNVNYGQKE